MRSCAMSEEFYEVIESLVQIRGHLIETFCTEMMEETTEMYAKAIHEQGAPFSNRVGFIECTKIAMCRSGGRRSLQSSVYSRLKRFHCLIYQTITTPDGLMFHLFGPEIGRRHDITLYRQSGLRGILETSFVISGKHYCIYGYAAYLLRPGLQVAFPRLNATPEQLLYNRGMISVRKED